MFKHLLKVGISGYGNLRTISTGKWVTSKSTQLSTKIWVKLLLLLEEYLLCFVTLRQNLSGRVHA